MAQAKHKSQDLIDELNDMDLGMEYSNPFGWRSRLNTIKREAEELQGEFVVRASIIQGMVACLLHNYQEMRAKHLNAINNAPNNALAYYNFAQSLRRASFYLEAIPYYEKAMTLDPLVPEWYAAATKNYASACYWNLAYETMMKHSRLTGNNSDFPEETIMNLNDAINQYGIDPSKIASLKKAADDFLRSKDLQPTLTVNTKRYSNDGDFIYCPIFVRANRETIKQLNYEFSDVLAASFDDIHSDKIVFSFVEDV